jgi:hypothetical protein
MPHHRCKFKHILRLAGTNTASVLIVSYLDRHWFYLLLMSSVIHLAAHKTRYFAAVNDSVIAVIWHVFIALYKNLGVGFKISVLK